MIDLQRFVELANKYAPEFDARWLSSKEVCLAGGIEYDAELYPDANANFTVSMLEYLKKRAAQFVDVVKSGEPLPRPFPHELKASLAAYNELRREWHTLTPEAVMQACIDVWEAME